MNRHRGEAKTRVRGEGEDAEGKKTQRALAKGSTVIKEDIVLGSVGIPTLHTALVICTVTALHTDARPDERRMCWLGLTFRAAFVGGRSGICRSRSSSTPSRHATEAPLRFHTREFTDLSCSSPPFPLSLPLSSFVFLCPMAMSRCRCVSRLLAFPCPKAPCC